MVKLERHSTPECCSFMPARLYKVNLRVDWLDQAVNFSPWPASFLANGIGV